MRPYENILLNCHVFRELKHQGRRQARLQMRHDVQLDHRHLQRARDVRNELGKTMSVSSAGGCTIAWVRIAHRSSRG